jgi:hypothetical protein
VTLSQTAQSIVEDPRRYLTWIYGPAGVGKTTFASQIDGHYFLQAEIGTAGVSVFGEGVPDWVTYMRIIGDLKAGIDGKWQGQREIKVVVIDLLERLFEHCGNDTCRNETFKGERYVKIEDVPYGAGYTRVCERLIRSFEYLRQLGLGVFLISHLKERQSKWRSQDIVKYEPNLPPSAILRFQGACDAVGFYRAEYETQKDANNQIVRVEKYRVIHWQPIFAVEAKHRLHYFPGILPIPKVDEAWKTYEAAFLKAVTLTKAEEIKEEETKSNG